MANEGHNEDISGNVSMRMSRSSQLHADMNHVQKDCSSMLVNVSDTHGRSEKRHGFNRYLFTGAGAQKKCVFVFERSQEFDDHTEMK